MKEYPIPNPEEDTPAGSGYPDTPEERDGRISGGGKPCCTRVFQR